MNPKKVLHYGCISVFTFIINSCSSPNCENNKSEYQNGNDAGKTVKILGGSGSCSSYVDSYNSETGRNMLKATDCFCSGFDDALEGKPIQ